MNRVVIIDDDAAVLASLEALLTASDCPVHAFASATTFLEALPGLSPACVITDLKMPEMDGLALLKHLETDAGLPFPVIVISGHGDATCEDAVRSAGAAAFLLKPFAPQQLLAVVKDLVRVPGPADGGKNA